MAKVNRVELARFLDCSLPTVTSKVTKGMPYLEKGGRGKEWMFDTADVITWIKNQAIIDAVGDLTQVDEDELKIRRLAAETGKAELELAKMRGEVGLISDFEKTTRDICIAISACMLLVPGRCSMQIVGLDNESEIKRIINDEIRQGLSESAEIEIEDAE